LWGGVGSVWHQFSLYHCPQPVTGLVSTTRNWIGVHNQKLDWCPDWCFRVQFPYSTQTFGFKNIWSRHLVQQFWPPDGCRRTERRLSTTLAAKGCVLFTQEERSFKWMTMKRGMVDKQGESYGCQLYVPGGIQSGLTDVREQWVSVWHRGSF